MKLRLASFLFAAALLVGLPISAPAAPPVAMVHIKDFAFVPAVLKVAAGTVVTFVNDDQEPHTVTAVNHAFDSEGLDTNQTWPHAFAKAGTYAYFCEMHPYMHGTVVVTAAP